jgi:hypothetical protein
MEELIPLGPECPAFSREFLEAHPIICCFGIVHLRLDESNLLSQGNGSVSGFILQPLPCLCIDVAYLGNDRIVRRMGQRKLLAEFLSTFRSYANAKLEDT